MTIQLTTRTSTGTAHRSTGAAGTGARQGTGPTRTAAGIRGRALLAALGLAMAAAVLPAGAVHASPQSPDVENQIANPGGNPQPPEPPDLPQWGPQDLANPTENPEPEPPVGPDDIVNPTEIPEPPNPTGDPDPSGGSSIPTPQRVDAGLGGAAIESHQVAGLALIAAAVVLALLVLVIARRHRAEARSAR